MIFITAKFQVRPEDADRWPQIAAEFTHLVSRTTPMFHRCCHNGTNVSSVPLASPGGDAG